MNDTFEGGLSVIMPAYDEEDVIYHSVTETARSLASWCCPFEIIVIEPCTQLAQLRSSE